MSDPICQLFEDIEGLCKRCYHLQKSNNEMYDYLKSDKQMQEFIDENDQIIRKYHRKIDEMIRLINENSPDDKEFQWSPIAQEFREKENEEKRALEEKKHRSTVSSTITTADDQGMFL